MKKWILLFLLLPNLAWGVTYTIGPGQTYTTFTLLVATETLAPDDIVDGGGNTFTETWTPDGSGTSGHPITLRNAIIDATGLTYGINVAIYEYFAISNIEVKNANDYGIRLRRANGSTVTGCTIHNIGTAGDDWPCEGIMVDASSNCTISGNTIYEIGRHGIQLIGQNTYATSSNVVANNTIYNCYHTGIDVDNSGTAGSGTVVGNIIRYNNIYANANYANFLISMNGIYVEGNAADLLVDNTEIYYNVIHDVPGKGIQLQYYVTDALIYNNTIANRNASYATDCAGLEVDDTGSSGIIVKNNIVTGYDNASAVAIVILSATASPAANVDYNMWYVDGAHKVVAIGASDYHQDDQALYKAAGYDVNAPTWADPLLASATNFHLQAASPCKNTGTSVGLTRDKDGIPIVGAVDIGAFEYFGGHLGTGITLIGGSLP